MITPYLKPFNTQGGTLYVFPSVSKDLTRTLVSNDYDFVFSHFACLNIPDLYPGQYDPEVDDVKGLYLSTLLDDEPTFDTNTAIEKTITENFQNYIMNFETAILNGDGDNDDYDNDILTNVSEKIFWNWMQKVGAIKFNDSGTAEVWSSYLDRTVQYIGDIDVMNTVDIDGESFEELYIHIPSTVGASTNVYFRTGDQTDNKNYLNKNYPVSGGETIIGSDDRTADNLDAHTTKYGLSRDAIFDNDDTNIYTGDIGHTIDFRDSSYDGGEGINNMNSKSLEDFEFNAILIYYDIYEKTSTPNVRRIATNLYGILFLDNATSITGDSDSCGYFVRYPKKKETVYGNGNSYALKLDLKVDTIGDTNCQYTTIGIPSDDPNAWNSERVVSMTHYVKALTQLQKCIDVFYEQKNELVKLSQRVDTLENLVMGIDSIASLKEDIQRLYNICNDNALVDTSTLLGLINENSNKLDNIMNGGKDLKLQYDTDVLQAGIGIGLQKSLNKVTINSEQKYAINTVIDGTSSNETEINANNPISTLADSKICNIKLKPGENFAVIYITDEGDCETYFNINIDDSESNWAIGQSLKIHFVCNNGILNFDKSSEKGFIIKVDSKSTITIPGYDEFNGNNLIELICIGEDAASGEKKFVYLIK